MFVFSQVWFIEVYDNVILFPSYVLYISFCLFLYPFHDFYNVPKGTYRIDLFRVIQKIGPKKPVENTHMQQPPQAMVSTHRLLVVATATSWDPQQRLQ